MTRDEELKDLKNAALIVSKVMNNIINKISAIEREMLREKQTACDHYFQYTGHGHNDDCYTCTKCNLSEWR